MIYLEACMLAILALLFLRTSISDLKSGKIGNKAILAALVPGAACAIPYYAFFAADCLLAYSVNAVFAIIISLILYALGIWGAGDSKLLLTTIILFPTRIYCLSNRSMASCFLLVALIFIIAFVYIVIDTLVLGIKQRDLLRIPKTRIDLKQYAKGFLFFFLFLSLANAVIVKALPESVLADTVLVTAVHFILILIGQRLEEKANWTVALTMGAVWLALIISGFSHLSLSGVNLIAYLIVIALMLFRLVADRYNYKTIEITQLKPGMILSAWSVLAFSESKVVGLPRKTSEDLKARLSAEEVERVNKWAKTKNGQKTITIVRKIPFALFIALGTVLFAVLEVLTA